MPESKARCSKCDTELSQDEATVFLGKTWCGKHYSEALGEDHQEREGTDAPTTSWRKYPALRTISNTSQVLAWILGLGIFVAGITAGLGLKDMAGNVSSIGIIIILIAAFEGTLLIVGLLALAELIKLLIDIEENTRTAKR